MALYENGKRISGIRDFPAYTWAEYHALPAAQRPKVWKCTDRDYTDVLTAGGVSYDNTLSGLSATEVQGAIDSLAPKNLIKKRTFSGTTNSNGEIGTAMPSTAIVVETQINNGYFRLRTARSGNNLYAIVGYANGTVLANTAVSGTVYYIEP